MQSKRLAIAALLFTLSATAAAAPPGPEVTRRVLDTATAYASAIACEAPALGPLDVVALSPYTSLEDRDDAEYLVFWTGDIGCSGGSGTATFNVTSVKVASGGAFVVDLKQSSPAVQVEALHGSRVSGHSSGAVLVDALDYADGDPTCCPSLKQRVSLRRNAAGSWVR